MSEEKKAIEIIKGLSIEEYEWYEDSKYCQGHSGEAVTIVEDSLKTILNLIDKQQKEIEDLKEKNNQLFDYLNDSYYVSADKIREKIKKAKEIKWHTPKLVIEYFEELLEEK